METNVVAGTSNFVASTVTDMELQPYQIGIPKNLREKKILPQTKQAWIGGQRKRDLNHPTSPQTVLHEPPRLLSKPFELKSNIDERTEGPPTTPKKKIPTSEAEATDKGRSDSTDEASLTEPLPFPSLDTDMRCMDKRTNKKDITYSETVKGTHTAVAHSGSGAGVSLIQSDSIWPGWRTKVRKDRVEYEC